MILENKLKKWGWQIAAAAVGIVVLIIVVLTVVLPKEKSDFIATAALDVQKQLSENAKAHEVRIAVAQTKHDAGKQELEAKLAKIDAEPDSHKRRQALIDMHKELL